MFLFLRHRANATHKVTHQNDPLISLFRAREVFQRRRRHRRCREFPRISFNGRITANCLISEQWSISPPPPISSLPSHCNVEMFPHGKWLCRQCLPLATKTIQRVSHFTLRMPNTWPTKFRCKVFSLLFFLSVIYLTPNCDGIYKACVVRMANWYFFSSSVNNNKQQKW